MQLKSSFFRNPLVTLPLRDRRGSEWVVEQKRYSPSREYKRAVLKTSELTYGLALVFALALAPGLRAQAVFGELIQLGGTPADVVLDESRHRLYFVNSPANRVDVYDYSSKTIIGSVPVGLGPLGAAMSMDSAFLYVANHDSSTLSVITLGGDGINSGADTISLPAKPQGVEVGADGRVLICTDGTGTTSTTNTLLIVDSRQASGSQVLAVAFPPPAATPPTLQALVARPTAQFNGMLRRTPDGQFIVGVTNFTNNNQASTALYVVEVASGTVLRNRIVVGQSSTLSVSPDGATFMAGFTMYDFATLSVVAQANTANAPFPLGTPTAGFGGTGVGAFSLTNNLGGSAFSPDGKTLYGAFNVAPNTNPAPPPQANTLLIADSRNLAIRLGLNLPESVLSKIVITADGNDVWALSSSGAIYIPISTMNNYPILMPDTTTVFLAQDDCNTGIAQLKVRINNLGSGKLTFAVPQTITGGPAVVAVASSGVAPADIMFTMDPGRSGAIARTPGTNLYTGGGTNNLGTAVNINLVSPDAINVIPTIRVFMNYRDSTQRGIVYPLPTTPNSSTAAYEGLQDIVLDESRQKVYITNSGYNRIEVFDVAQGAFVDPIPVGQLPHLMAMGLDGSTLYVTNTGGESVQIIDLDQKQVVGSIQFPPIPRAGNAAVTFVQGMAAGASGLQLVMSNGNLWKVVNNQAIPRVGTNITGVSAAGAQTAIAAPRTMIGSPDGLAAILLGGTGRAYYYDAVADSYTTTAQLFNNPIIGFYGPLGVASSSNFLLANGLVMNRSLTAIGGAASPGQITITPPTGPGPGGGGFQIGVTTTGLRNVASAAPINEKNFVRMSTAVRNNLTTATSDDVHPILEAVDTKTGATAMAARIPENPVFSVFSTARVNMPARQMAVGSDGTVYALTMSGLSVVPLTPATTKTQPQVSTAANGVVNAADGSRNFKPGSFITINGANLGASTAATALPPPTLLGGSCVLVGGTAIPLLTTSSGQIQAQLPASIRTGANTLQVRSLAMAQQSNAVVITIQKP